MNTIEDKYSVLILEDDIDLVRQWSQAFREKNIGVEHALTVFEAEAHCAVREFDAIVCDIFIKGPKGNYVPSGGYTLLAYFRDNPKDDMPKWTKDVPILVVTGSPKTLEFDALTLAEHFGSTAVMRKPFEVSEIVNKIIDLIDQK